MVDKNVKDDIRQLDKKIEDILNDKKMYGVSRIYQKLLVMILIVNLIGIPFNFWDFSFVPIIAIILYDAVVNLYNNLLSRIEINTLKIHSVLLSEINSVKQEINKS